MAWTEYDSRTCSVARSMEILGERWSMLILRDMFQGVSRFEDLQRHLGAPRAVLTERLKSLTAAGLIERVAYQEDGSRQRYEYRPTAMGYDLRPVMIGLINWGDRYLAGADGPPVQFMHDECGAELHTQLVCAHGHEVANDGRIATRPLTGARMAG